MSDPSTVPASTYVPKANITGNLALRSVHEDDLIEERKFIRLFVGGGNWLATKLAAYRPDVQINRSANSFLLTCRVEFVPERLRK